MRRMFGWAAAAVLAVAGAQLATPIFSSVAAQGDPFDNARHNVVNKQNAEALAIVDGKAFPIDQANYEGWTLLHYAAEAGNLEMVKALLARGANPALKTKWGSTPYEVASATMVKTALAQAGGAQSVPPTVRGPVTAARPAPAAPAKAQSARDKMCQARWYSSQALCSDSTCKMREYRKWATCKKTGSYV